MPHDQGPAGKNGRKTAPPPPPTSLKGSDHLPLWKIASCWLRGHDWLPETHHRQGFNQRQCARCAMVQHRHWNGFEEWCEQPDGRYARLSFTLAIMLLGPAALGVVVGLILLALERPQ